ncbi:MAG TPA: hypothetical protein ENN60_00480 [archaeon]|nr:hypothetical protein [archaeon]
MQYEFLTYALEVNKGNFAVKAQGINLHRKIINLNNKTQGEKIKQACEKWHMPASKKKPPEERLLADVWENNGKAILHGELKTGYECLQRRSSEVRSPKWRKLEQKYQKGWVIRTGHDFELQVVGIIPGTAIGNLRDLASVQKADMKVYPDKCLDIIEGCYENFECPSLPAEAYYTRAHKICHILDLLGMEDAMEETALGFVRRFEPKIYKLDYKRISEVTGCVLVGKYSEKGQGTRRFNVATAIRQKGDGKPEAWFETYLRKQIRIRFMPDDTCWTYFKDDGEKELDALITQ